jgi:flagellar hook-length control protein FliK
MNIDYFAVKESPRADSGGMTKKDTVPNGSERRDFVSSYQAARQQREDRIEVAQNRASARERRDQSDAAQANKSRRDRDRELAQSAAAEVKEKSTAESVEGEDNGKSLPSSEQGGNSMQANAADIKDVAPVAEQFDEGLKEAFIKAQQLQSQESELSEQESIALTAKDLLPEQHLDSESEAALVDKSEMAELLSTDVVTDKSKVMTDEEIENLEQTAHSDTDEVEIVSSVEARIVDEPALDAGDKAEELAPLAEIDLSPESTVVTDTSKQNSELKNNAEAVDARSKEAALDDSEVETSEIQQNTVLGEAKEIPADKITAAPISSAAAGQKVAESSISSVKNKGAASQTTIEPSATKISADAYFEEGMSEDALEEQQSLLKAETGKSKGDVKSFLSENLSVSELALKEAKSSIGTKVSDFAKTLGAEKLPLRETIELPVSHKNWGEALAEKTALLVSQRGNFARLNLVPHNLGPLEVRVELQGEKSAVEFIAVNPATKEAIESAIPRLREMFESGGLELGDVNVNSQSKKDGEAERLLKPQKGEVLGDADMDAAEEEALSRVGGSLVNGRVDFYA